MFRLSSAIYIETCFQFVEVNSDEAAVYDELLSVNDASSLVHLGLGKVKLFQKEFTQAEEHLRNGIFIIIYSF